MNKRNAFTLLELSIVLAIIGILIVGVVGISSGLRQTAFITEAAQNINALHGSANQYLAIGNTNFTGISITALQTANLLPAGFSGTATNPWGGNYSVAANASDSSKIDIQLTSVPTNAGNKLVTMFGNSAAATPTFSSGTFTVTF